MRLVFITTGLSTGGAEAMLLKLLENIDRQKFEPNVISLTSLGEVGPRIAKLGIPVQALAMAPGKPGVLSVLRLVRLLRNLRPDIVQTWMYHADLIGGVAARLAGCKLVVWGLRNGDAVGRYDQALNADGGSGLRYALLLAPATDPFLFGACCGSPCRDGIPAGQDAHCSERV